MTATLGSSALIITATGAVQTDVGDQIVAFDPNGANLGLTNLDAAVSTRSTFAGGAVASVTGAVGSVTAPVTAGTVTDKTGYSATVSGYAAGQDPATLLLSSSFVTVPTTGTTTGVAEVLTQKQVQSLYLSVASGNNVPSGPPVASGSLTVTYYLVGLPSVAANVVEVATVNYDASRNQTSRTVKIAQPFPSIL